MKLGHPLVLSLVVTATAGCSGPVDGDDAFAETTSGSPTSGDGPGSTTSGEGGSPAGTTTGSGSPSSQDASSSTSGGEGGSGGSGSGGDAASTGGGAGEGGAGTGGSGTCEDGPCDDGDGCTEDDTCEDGVCAGSARTCGPPPGPTCADEDTLRMYSGAGVCADDECSWDETDSPCPSGCAAGACSPTIVTSVSAGSYHTCAVTTSGGVVCWGSNFSGELGNGTTSNDPVTAPVQVSGLSSGVRSVTAGQNATCALLTNGAIRCWGNNDYGTLGNGTQTSSSVPVQVTGFASGGEDVSLHYYGVCAATSGGEARCWGRLLGDQTVPVTVSNVSGAVAITAGGGHACVRSEPSGQAWCWGNNYAGQLGNDSTTDSAIGRAVAGSSDMSVVSAGLSHTCGIVFGGAVCWGQGFSGTLGNGTISNSSVPVAVTGLGSGVAAISGGLSHTCAVTTDGAVKCWGSNQFGQLGVDTNIDGSLVPVDVQGL